MIFLFYFPVGFHNDKKMSMSLEEKQIYPTEEDIQAFFIAIKSGSF